MKIPGQAAVSGRSAGHGIARHQILIRRFRVRFPGDPHTWRPHLATHTPGDPHLATHTHCITRASPRVHALLRTAAIGVRARSPMRGGYIMWLAVK
jgi:hypothetical protein